MQNSILIQDMSTITVNLKEDLKESIKKKLRKDGITLTFVVNQILRAYRDGKINFEVVGDETITASFDVSTKKGREECLQSFKSLMK